jgi:flavin reductase (DIM6/NTAB) family NADH-FMN oxidoreductase RutF
MTVGGTALRSVLRSYASGVVILTAQRSARPDRSATDNVPDHSAPTTPDGVTITSFTSISAEPALVGFALADTSSTWHRIKHTEWFGIQVLRANQRDLAERFATPASERFAGVSWHPGPRGVPLLDGCLSWLVCRQYEYVRLGDHHMLVGQVHYALAGAPGDSLIHVNGALQPVPSIAHQNR